MLIVNKNMEILSMKNYVITLALMLATATCASAADTFVPLDFGKTTTRTTIPSEFAVSTVGNSNMQNAILELDSAQIEVRDELLNCKTKYSDIEAKLALIKAEHKAVKRQMRSIENRIRRIEAVKENIRRNML
jgi:septal ring factor EnvC (AmiA/AmiB activator)